MPITVFLCSTFEDLAEERKAVLDAVRRLQLAHDSMEFFGARDDRSLATCLAEVRKSQILVVVVGHRYGSIAPEVGVSFSQAEYEEGLRLGKPCLVYLLDEAVPVLLKNVERDPAKLQLLEAWKHALRKRHTVAVFKASSDLSVQVIADLSRTLESLGRQESRSEPERSVATLAGDLAAAADPLLRAGISRSTILEIAKRAFSNQLLSAGKRRPTAFLTYSHADKEIVKQVAHQLLEQGVNVWYDAHQIGAGDNIADRVDRGVESADFLVFFMSESSLRSAWVTREVDAAITRQASGSGVRVLPVLLDNSALPPLFRSVHYVDLRDDNVENAVRVLLRAIHRSEP